MPQKQFRVFLSAVTSEFGNARDELAADLRAREMFVRVQSDFRQEADADTTLRKLHNFIRDCNAVVCIIGKRSGALPPPAAATPFARMLPPGVVRASYAQWEFFFARYYKQRLSIYVANDDYQPNRSESTTANDGQLQADFLAHVVDEQDLDRRYFSNKDQLCREVLREDWPKPSTTIEELWRLVRSPVPWIIITTAALPLLAAAIGLAPPWPRGAAAMTAIIGAFATGLVYHLVKERMINRLMRLAALALPITACGYLAAMSFFTFQTPTTKEHWAKGFVCTADAVAVYRDKCPNLGIDELRATEYQAERLWTSQSVTVVRVALVVLWMGIFVSVAIILGSFLASRSQVLSPARSAPDDH
jgi:hypothetical protein